MQFEGANALHHIWFPNQRAWNIVWWQLAKPLQGQTTAPSCMVPKTIRGLPNAQSKIALPGRILSQTWWAESSCRMLGANSAVDTVDHWLTMTEPLSHTQPAIPSCWRPREHCQSEPKPGATWHRPRTEPLRSSHSAQVCARAHQIAKPLAELHICLHCCGLLSARPKIDISDFAWIVKSKSHVIYTIYFPGFKRGNGKSIKIIHLLYIIY